MVTAPPPLDRVTAHSVVEPYFVAVQELALVRFPLTKGVRLEIHEDLHDTPRHFAGCRTDGKLIAFAPEAADLPEATLLAILAHEFGHAVDFLYPARWVLDANRKAVERRLEDADEEQVARWMRAWQNRDDDVIEFTADAIGELIAGRAIGYCGPCELQCFGGKPRREGLR